MTRCVVCGARCIPLADYDTPVCIACDQRHENADLRLDLILSRPVHPAVDDARSPANPALQQLAAEVTAQTYGRRVPEYHNDGTPPPGVRRPFERTRLRVVEGGAA